MSSKCRFPISANLNARVICRRSAFPLLKNRFGHISGRGRIVAKFSVLLPGVGRGIATVSIFWKLTNPTRISMGYLTKVFTCLENACIEIKKGCRVLYAQEYIDGVF